MTRDTAPSAGGITSQSLAAGKPRLNPGIDLCVAFISTVFQNPVGNKIHVTYSQHSKICLLSPPTPRVQWVCLTPLSQNYTAPCWPGTENTVKESTGLQDSGMFSKQEYWPRSIDINGN